MPNLHHSLHSILAQIIKITAMPNDNACDVVITTLPLQEFTQFIDECRKALSECQPFNHVDWPEPNNWQL